MDLQTITSSLPNVSLPRTQSALACLQNCLHCRKCSQLCKELFTLGQCEHRFCWSCAQDRQGNTCSVCNMPSHATQVHVDKQLSNIASLCLQMSDLLNGKHLASVDVQIKDDLATTKETVTHRNRRKSDIIKSQVQRYDSTRRKSMKNLTTSTKIGKYEADETSSKYPSDKKRRSEKDEFQNTTKTVLSESSFSKVRESKLTSSNLHNTDVLRSKTSTSIRKQRKQAGQQNVSADESLIEDRLERLPTTDASNVKEALSERKIEISTKERTKSKTYLIKRNAKGETPLQVATIKADVERVRHLLEDGANPNVRDNAGWTPLHEAVNLGNDTIAELLINYGASVNAPGLDNDTPLHDAVVNYRLECVRLLMSRGANNMARNINGHTPLDQARTDEMREILLMTSISTPLPAPDINTSMIKELESDQPLCLLGTVLSQDEQAVLQKCAQLLNAKLVDDISSEVTHLITGVNAVGMCPRTLKYLNVVLAGKWVVSSRWLNKCIECGSRVLEEEFEITGCTNYPNTMTPMKARQNALNQLPGLFDGCQFYFHGKFKSPTPSREELASLVKLGGGVILTREPRLYSLDDYPYTVPFHALPLSDLVDCSIFVIYDDACLNPPRVEAQRMTCLPASWMMDSIASFSLLDKVIYSKKLVQH